MANSLLSAAMASQSHPQLQWAFSYTNDELTLMRTQAALLEESTREVFDRAGLTGGMRVLDFGCGIGDVALLAAALVNPGGSVIGIDRDPRAIHYARARVDNLPIRFEISELGELEGIESLATPFDAVVGRCVLCHQSNPASVLRKIASVLRPGGLVVFVEPEADVTLHVNPGLPETTRCAHVICETLRKAGVQMNCGTRLSGIFHEAGLPLPETSTHVVMDSGADFAGYDYWAKALAVLLPLAKRFGIEPANEINLEGLAGRIREEVARGRSSLVTHLLVGAWVRRVGAHPDMIAFR